MSPQETLPDKPSLAVTHPDLANEWHPQKNGDVKPSDVTHGSGQKVWWICEKQHEWEATVSKRSNGRGCPYCAGQKVSLERSLGATFPMLTREWHPQKNGSLTPFQVRPKSNKLIWWICEKGHEWKASPSNRVKGSGCPYCLGRHASPEYNLAVINPKIARQWHPTKNGILTPFDVVPASSRKYWWLCRHGHEWEASPAQRRNSENCPFCLNRRVSISNNLSTLYPKLAAEWHPTKNGTLKTDQVVAGSGKVVWWKCQKGHEWKASICDRAKGRQCAKCIGKQAHSHHNLALKLPDLAKEWHPSKNGALTPRLVTPRSNKKVWWQCSRGHEWESSVSNRAKGQNCPECKPNTSLPEIRLFSELKFLFHEVLWRHRVDGIECDIFIPKYGAAVEYDGAFWHMERTEQDALKNEKLEGMSIRLFRVRGEGLPRSSENDILLSDKQTRDPEVDVVKSLLSVFSRVLNLDEQDTNKVADYLRRNDFANPKEFRRIVSYLPGPPLEKSLLGETPEVAKQWHYTKNSPLTPEMFSPHSGKKVWWICEKRS
nr:zinc-ribbon domain-containing protein [Desulfomonile tiedjei]